MRKFGQNDLVECLHYFWNVHRQPLVHGNEIVKWAAAPKDRAGVDMAPMEVDDQRWSIWNAANFARDHEQVMRFKGGPERNKPVYCGLMTKESPDASEAALMEARAKGYIIDHRP